MEEKPNDIPLNDNNNTSFNYVNKYTPFKFNLNYVLKENNTDSKKY